MSVFVPAVFEASAPRFLKGGGEMGALMRAHDWSASDLGLPEQLPQTLRTVIHLMLNTRHPIYIFWGPDSLCFYNDAYRQSLGPERHPGSLGKPAREVWKEVWDGVGPQIDQVMSGGEATWHENALFVTTRNGRRDDIYWTYSYSPINYEPAPSGVGGVLVVCTETTTAVEAQMLEAQRIDALGQLTGGIAHDFNNLLTPIMGGIDLLAQKLADNVRAQRIAAGAMASAERARTLVQRLLAFGRRQTLQSSVVSLAALIDRMRELVGRTMGPAITVSIDIPDDLPLVEVDPVQLELAILNLCANASHAMPEGGHLTIAARSVAPSVVGAARPVSLRLTDTGHGMDRETLERAIEPFFTTKDVGEGAGLGLSMVEGLAAQMGGKLVLTSAVGVGTTAELYLPAATVTTTASAGIVAGPQPVSEAPQRAKIILLVDDEEIVRMTMADDLGDLGYAVAEASSGAEALALVSAGLVPDLLVTDYRMSGITGATLIREIRVGLPSLPALMVTGYAHLAPEETRGFEVLAKPFRMADLAARVGALLNAGAFNSPASSSPAGRLDA